MNVKSKTIEDLEAELEELRYQLFEANETIEAIRTGQVDALVVESNEGHQLYTLKTADQAYRVFIENMTEGAVTLNQQGIMLYANPQFASMVNHPLSKLIGHDFENFIATDYKAFYQSTFRQCWQQDCKVEMLLQCGDHTTPVQLSLTSLALEGGLSLSIILTDLTSQKQTQQQLTLNNKQLADINHALELSNHDLQQFASVASHDLQEPLRKIQMFSNLLQHRCGESISEEAKKYVEKIIGSASRMKSLIIDVLSYSKLSATNNLFECIDLNDVVKELVDDFELSVAERCAVITTNNLPAIEGNRGQMRQMFQNLLSNALKFSKDNQPPVIHIQAKRLQTKSFSGTADNNGPYCFISIKDNGIGFEEKYVSNIFELFERLHVKDVYEGTGIGLAITKKIVEKHNGFVTAKSKPGEGAEFMLLLPMVQERKE